MRRTATKSCLTIAFFGSDRMTHVHACMFISSDFRQHEQLKFTPSCLHIYYPKKALIDSERKKIDQFINTEISALMAVSPSQAEALPSHMYDEDIEESFEDAATCVQTAVSSGVKLDQNEMLEVYGLYKQATEGQCTSFRPSFLRMKERAKWDAWKIHGDLPTQDAKLAYITRVRALFPEDGNVQAKDGRQSGGGAVQSSLIQDRGNPEDLPEMCRLHELAQDGNEAELANLLDSGANINERDSDGSTPLHFACDSGSVKIVKMLLDCGADIDSQNEDKETPLHFATLQDHEELIQILLRAGAKTNLQNSESKTAFDLAAPHLQYLFQNINGK